MQTKYITPLLPVTTLRHSPVYRTIHKATLPQRWNTGFRWLILLHNVSAFLGLYQVHGLVCIATHLHRVLYSVWGHRAIKLSVPRAPTFPEGKWWHHNGINCSHSCINHTIPSSAKPYKSSKTKEYIHHLEYSLKLRVEVSR